MKRIFIEIWIVIGFMISSCNRVQTYRILDEIPDTFPDYSDVVIPSNIAPLNFYIRGDNCRYMVRLIAETDSFDVYCNHHINIPPKKWKKLLTGNTGKKLTMRLFADKKTAGWVKYRDMTLNIAAERIDPYIAYRLIAPGYEYWDKMGIYQRNLESFDETPILINTLSDESCMNCHSFCKNDPEKMLFHVRAIHAGTILVKNKMVVKLNTKTPDNISAAVYPRWHPDGRYIAFSTNQTSQAFHSVHNNLVEVYDSASDLIILDTETQTVSSHPLIHSSERFETYPEWSPDGKSLYFCSAKAMKMPESYDSLRYDLFRIDFDPKTGMFGNKIDTIWQPSSFRKSAAFPRISPDGKYMVVCLSDYGTFPIWHHENDLYLLNLQTGKFAAISELNSAESDSYHSWSSNGRWLVFSSRRLDGLYTRPFIAYFDTEGQFHKPFLLPQRDPELYDKSLKSFNVPEFISGKIQITSRQFERTVKIDALINVK